MKSTTKMFMLMVLILWQIPVGAQVGAARYFPDVAGYKTLICDFHMHTVFSDGTVWPTVRVDEAWREGLDAISITDHIEYQPHEKDIPTQHNRPYEIAKDRARQLNVLLIKGTEITRDTPPGHYNALFLKDIDPLDTEEFLACIQKANEQKGFLFWNHHTWKGTAKGQWEEIQTQMFKKKWLHGMEVANGGTYYPLAHQWCLDRGLTMIGNSDIHSPSIQSDYSAEEHRTLTLVFTKTRTVAAIKEALEAQRTAVWYKNQLIGSADLLEALFRACVEVQPPHHIYKEQASLVLANSALIDMKIKYTVNGQSRSVTLPARSRIIAKVPFKSGEVTPIDIKVDNFLVAPNRCLSIRYEMAQQLAVR